MKNWLKIAAGFAAAAAFPIHSAPAGDQRASPDTAVCSIEDASVARFRAGDRITLTQYERIEPNPNDRLPVAATAYPSYRLRAEVSGDFSVAEDGTISIPILGQFDAAGKSVQELRDAIGRSFGSTLGHVGIITIAIAEHQPVYVDGAIKNPGAYKYTPGLTALHAVSLAGGYEDIKLESHAILLQTMQEANTGEQAKQTLERLLARDAVLRADLESKPVSAPQALLDLVGETRANALIAAQASERKTLDETNAVQQEQQARLMDSAQQALDVRQSQVRFMDTALAERGARINTAHPRVGQRAQQEPGEQHAFRSKIFGVFRRAGHFREQIGSGIILADQLVFGRGEFIGHGSRSSGILTPLELRVNGQGLRAYARGNSTSISVRNAVEDTVGLAVSHQS